MSQDGKLNTLSLPGTLVDPAPDRGGTDVLEVASAHRAIADAGTRKLAPASETEAADAAKRRQLITEIRAMQRAKANVAIEGLISGAMWGVASQLAVEALRWWIDARAMNKDAAPKRAPEAVRRADNARDPEHVGALPMSSDGLGVP